MKAKRLESDRVRVTVSRHDVLALARRWPCSGLEDRGFSVDYERAGDGTVQAIGGTRQPRYSDYAALDALLRDALAFARAAFAA